jgi:cytochrome c peroxidase
MTQAFLLLVLVKRQLAELVIGCHCWLVQQCGIAGKFALGRYCGFVVAVLLVNPGHAEAADKHSRATRSQSATLTELGRTLFFDVRFSQDGKVSCASCHQLEKAFTDGRVVAQGVHDKQGTRNTPSLRNATYTQAKFWDGRRADLDSQVLDPFINAQEHGLRDHAELLQKLHESTDYNKLWQRAFGSVVSSAELTDLTQALSAYVRSLKQTNTRLDRYLFRRNGTALNLNERRGLELFRGRAQCTTCHLIGKAEAPLTDGDYHSLALGFERLTPQLPRLIKTVAATPRQDIDRLISADAEVAALGRFVVTLRPADIGKFKTPSLRNVADTAPYMHDGSIATLEEAVEREIYYRGKTLGRPVMLSLAERADLLAFLKALTETPTEQQQSRISAPGWDNGMKLVGSEVPSPGWERVRVRGIE